jgi:dienelactone hydrolase
LKGLIWIPAGRGPFPAVLFAHGSYGGSDLVHDPVSDAVKLGTLFVEKGYIFFVPFRRGVGLSAKEGINSTDLMDQAFAKEGQEGRNRVQLQQLESFQLADMMAALDCLRARPEVDRNRMAILGHSFGGSLAILVADGAPGLKAAIIFSGGGYSWDRSFSLRQLLINAVKSINMPVMIIHANNDYSINPGIIIDSVRKQIHKPDTLIIYPRFGNTANEGHNLIFSGTAVWQKDVFAFLHDNIK